MGKMTIVNHIDDRLVSRIRKNLDSVRQKIVQAADMAQRDPAGIRLVVVSKFQPVEVIKSAIEAGVKELGENYAEQAAPKIEALRDFPTIQWHMVGHVQSRKARMVCQYFHFVHSVDTVRLAEKLESACQEFNRTLPVLLEFNLGGEESKFGWNIRGDRIDPAIAQDIEKVTQLPHLQVRGLMTMPPMTADAEQARPYFRRLAKLRLSLQDRFPHIDWRDLSMGTSVDFSVAVEEGATFVRIGQAILGPRPKQGPITEEQH